MATRLKKDQFLAHWAALPANQPIRPEIVPYKHEGSTYHRDGIRITGSREFIDSVLSRLKDLLANDNGSTRLHVNYAESVDRVAGVSFGSWNCYIQVHERGREAQMYAALTGYLPTGGRIAG